jgi:hypothetical protein
MKIYKPIFPIIFIGYFGKKITSSLKEGIQAHLSSFGKDVD